MGPQSYFQKFAVLKDVRREYWGVQIINVFDCLYSFAQVTVATIFMSRSLGFSDIAAGAVITWMGIATSIFLLIVGPIIDRHGVRKALFGAIGGALLVRGTLTLAAFWEAMPFRGVVFVSCLLIGCFPGSFKSVCNHIANRRFTTARSQAAGFNIWYIGVNVGAFCAGLVVDGLHLSLGLSYAWVFATGMLIAVCSVPVAWFLIRDDKPLEESVGALGADEAGADAVAADAPAAAGRGWAAKWRYTKEVVRHPAFLRMISAVTLLMGVRAAFLYWTTLSPKYWLRVIGEKARIGLLTSINPFVIVIGLLLLVPIINRYKTFSMLLTGAFIAALSFAPMCVPWQWVSSDMTTAYYAMTAVSMVLFAIGEMMFSPRLSNYIIAISPVGQEGIYSSFASLPWFIGKTVAGFMSGVMLMRWCPERFVLADGTSMPLRDALSSGAVAYGDSPEMMWLVLGLVALAGPCVMFLCRRWFLSGMRVENKKT